MKLPKSPIDLEGQAWVVWVNLCRYGERRVRDLTNDTHYSRSSVHRIMNAFQELGWAERKDPENRLSPWIPIGPGPVYTNRQDYQSALMRHCHDVAEFGFWGLLIQLEGHDRRVQLPKMGEVWEPLSDEIIQKQRLAREKEFRLAPYAEIHLRFLGTRIETIRHTTDKREKQTLLNELSSILNRIGDSAIFGGSLPGKCRLCPVYVALLARSGEPEKQRV